MAKQLINLLAQDSIFGKVNPPPGVDKFDSGELTGLPLFLNGILKFMIVAAGIYALITLITAGYKFMSAGDDAKKVGDAWATIWQTMLGLAVAAGAFILAAIFGKIIFDDYGALLQFRVFGPGTI